NKDNILDNLNNIDNLNDIFPEELTEIIASYADIISLDVTWKDRTYQIHVPRILPDSGVRLWNLRNSVGYTIGVPPFMVKGLYQKEGYKAITLLTTGFSDYSSHPGDLDPIDWEKRKIKDTNPQRGPWWQCELKKSEEARESINVSNDTAEFFSV